MDVRGLQRALGLRARVIRRAAGLPALGAARRMHRGAAALAAFLLAACGGAGAESPAPARPPARPARIVSLNPCVDLVLAHVADPGQILAISHWSHDPRSGSAPLAWARRFPATGGSAEEVVALRPDLVIAGPHAGLPTIAALERLGIPLVRVPVPETIAESLAQVETIARVVGHPERGQALAARLRAALAAHSRAGPPVGALVWQGGGLVPGEATLADALLRKTGHANRAAAHGIAAWGVIGLERLVADPPEAIYAGEAAPRDRVLGHPVMARLGTRVVLEHFPGRLLSCAGPNKAEAARRMAAGHDRAMARRRGAG